ARLWHGTAADKACLTHRVMRRFERTLGYEAAAACKACDGMDLCDLKSLFKFERRQDRRETPGKHRLSGSRRADEKNVVAAGACALQSSFCGFLSADLRKIDGVARRIALKCIGIELQRPNALCLSELKLAADVHSGSQIRNRIDRDALNDGSLEAVLFRDEKMLDLVIAGGESDRQRASHRPDAPVERQFPDRHHAFHFLAVRQVTVRTQNAEGRRQVEACAFFS